MTDEHTRTLQAAADCQWVATDVLIMAVRAALAEIDRLTSERKDLYELIDEHSRARIAFLNQRDNALADVERLTRERDDLKRLLRPLLAEKGEILL